VLYDCPAPGCFSLSSVLLDLRASLAPPLVVDLMQHPAGRKLIQDSTSHLRCLPCRIVPEGSPLSEHAPSTGPRWTMLSRHNQHITTV
jgi:hypothetical protein